jgi:hypothetical protein
VKGNPPKSHGRDAFSAWLIAMILPCFTGA